MSPSTSTIPAAITSAQSKTCGPAMKISVGPSAPADNADGRKAAQIRDGFQKPGQQRKHRRAKADEPQRAFAERVARQLRGKLCPRPALPGQARQRSPHPSARPRAAH